MAHVAEVGEYVAAAGVPEELVPQVGGPGVNLVGDY